MFKKLPHYCELGFKIDKKLNGGEIGRKNNEFFMSRSKKFTEEINRYGKENFPNITVEIDKEIPIVDKGILDNEIDFINLCENHTYYLDLFRKHEVFAVKYKCIGHYEAGKEEGGEPALIGGCKGCRYLKTVS